MPGVRQTTLICFWFLVCPEPVLANDLVSHLTIMHNIYFVSDIYNGYQKVAQQCFSKQGQFSAQEPTECQRRPQPTRRVRENRPTINLPRVFCPEPVLRNIVARRGRFSAETNARCVSLLRRFDVL